MLVIFAIFITFESSDVDVETNNYFEILVLTLHRILGDHGYTSVDQLRYNLTKSGSQLVPPMRYLRDVYVLCNSNK